MKPRRIARGGQENDGLSSCAAFEQVGSAGAGHLRTTESPVCGTMFALKFNGSCRTLLLSAAGVVERVVALIAPPGTVSGPAQFIRRHRPSPEIALLGLYEISKMLNGAARLDQTLGNVVNVLTSFLDMRLGMIVILDGEEEPEIVATAGWASEVKGKPIETLPRAVIDRLVATSTPIVIEDIAKDPLFAKAADLILSRLDGHASFLGVPIKSDDKVIGTLSIERVWDTESAIGFDDDLSF